MQDQLNSAEGLHFIQFLGREAYDVVLQQLKAEGKTRPKGHYPIPFEEIIRKLDSDFFTGRWARATDRQRDMLTVIAHLPNSDKEFSILEVVEKSRTVLDSGFSSSLASQMLVKLADAGLVYKNRHGKYSFAVPLLNRFILRQRDTAADLDPFRD